MVFTKSLQSPASYKTESFLLQLQSAARVCRTCNYSSAHSVVLPGVTIMQGALGRTPILARYERISAQSHASLHTPIPHSDAVKRLTHQLRQQVGKQHIRVPQDSDQPPPVSILGSSITAFELS